MPTWLIVLLSAIGGIVVGGIFIWFVLMAAFEEIFKRRK